MVCQSGNCPSRRLAEKFALLLIGLAIVHTWFVEGFPVLCQVDGGSMALTLLGRHVDLTCPECGFAFPCDAGSPREARRENDEATVICPSCAARFEPAQPGIALSGDRVLIDRSAFQLRRPRRWEVVAFARPDEGPELTVKRVVGLPGEKVQLAGGRVYIDNELLRRDLRQQRAMRVLVHDDAFSGPAPRWRPQDYGSNWTRHDGRVVHTESPNDEIGWLAYNHEDAAEKGTSLIRRNGPEGTAHESEMSPSSPVSDYGYYNRGRMQSRNESVHRTPDVAMSFRLQDVHGRGVIWLQASDGRDEFMVEIEPAEKTFTVRKNRGKQPLGAGELPGPLRGETIDVSLIDRQFLFAVGSKTLFTATNDSGTIDSAGDPPLTAQPLAIGVQGLGVAVDRLRVYRAIYYGGPPGSGREPGPIYTVGPDEYFVLGDNNPISEDSRTWAQNSRGQNSSQDPMVSHKFLAGKPFIVIYPARGFSLAGRQFQVPDLMKIRYIR